MLTAFRAITFAKYLHQKNMFGIVYGY